MKKSSYHQQINDISYGVCKSLTNFLLYLFFLTGSSIGKQGSRGVYQAFYETDKLLEDFNYDSIVSAIKQLKRKSKITTDKSGVLSLSPQVYQQIKNSTNLFRQQRIWNKNIYLILYDVPVSLNKKRAVLRNFLRKFGAIALQDSAYICLYNPKSVLKDFLEEQNIKGIILVTEMTKDSSIGEEPLPKLISRIYNLGKVNSDYKVLWQQISKRQLPLTKLFFKFLSLYEEDPKLPYEFLPRVWYGKLIEDYLRKQGFLKTQG